ELYGLAAAAGGNLVRVVEDELGLHLVGLVVHLGAEQEQHGLGVDQDFHALVLDHLVGGADLVSVFDGVGLTGAAAVLDADAQADDLGIGALGQFVDARSRGVRQLHHLRTGARFRLGSGGRCHIVHLVSPRRRFNAASFQASSNPLTLHHILSTR